MFKVNILYIIENVPRNIKVCLMDMQKQFPLLTWKRFPFALKSISAYDARLLSFDVSFSFLGIKGKCIQFR